MAAGIRHSFYAEVDGIARKVREGSTLASIWMPRVSLLPPKTTICSAYKAAHKSQG